MQENALLLGMFLDRPSLINRLKGEFVEASCEFRKDPKSYIASLVKGDGFGGHRRKMLLRFGLAIGLLAYAIFFAAVLVFWTHDPVKQQPVASEKEKYIYWVGPPGTAKQEVEMGKADENADAGGGGGGHNMLTPASQGQPPPFAPKQPFITPSTRVQTSPPVLAFPETLLGDPAENIKRDDFTPTGLLTGVPGPASDGPGSNGGVGSGGGGGVGPGIGPGYGPGEGGNRGGGVYGPRGRGYDRDVADVFDMKPVLLNRPRPNYTEEARKNKIQGVVRTRILIGLDGLVKQVRIIGGGLPHGLNEEAIRAASQLRFKPATKNGQPVASWQTLEIEFNLR